MLGRIVSKSLWRDKKSGFWNGLILAGCACLVAIYSLLSLDLPQKMEAQLQKMGANGVLRPKPSTQQKDWENLEKLLAQNGLESLFLAVHSGRIKSVPVNLIRSDALKLEQMTSYWAISGKRPESPSQCLVGKKVADYLKLSLQDQILFKVGQEELSLQVSGIFYSGDEDEENLFAPSSRPILSHNNPLHIYGLVIIPGEKKSKALEENLEKSKLPLLFYPIQRLFFQEKAILKKMELLSFFSLLTALVLTTLGVGATTVSQVVHRSKELALMKTLGAKSGKLIQILLLENLFLGLAGSLSGFLLGWAISNGVSHNIFQMAVQPSFLALFLTLGLTLGMACSSALAAAWKILKIQPAMVLRGE